MQVIENEPHCVVPHRLDPDNADLSPPSHRSLLPRIVPLDLSARTFHAQILRRQGVLGSIIKRDMEHTRRAVQPDLRGSRRHCYSSFRASSGSMIGIPSRIGYASPALRLISSPAARSYSSGALVNGQTRTSSNRGSTAGSMGGGEA